MSIITILATLTSLSMAAAEQPNTKVDLQRLKEVGNEALANMMGGENIKHGDCSYYLQEGVVDLDSSQVTDVSRLVYVPSNHKVEIGGIAFQLGYALHMSGEQNVVLVSVDSQAQQVFFYSPTSLILILRENLSLESMQSVTAKVAETPGVTKSTLLKNLGLINVELIGVPSLVKLSDLLKEDDTVQDVLVSGEAYPVPYTFPSFVLLKDHPAKQDLMPLFVNRRNLPADRWRTFPGFPEL